MGGGTLFTSYGVDLPGGLPLSGSGISLTSLLGDVSVISLQNATESQVLSRSLGSLTSNLLWPATVALRAGSGDVTLNLLSPSILQQLSLVPSSTGGLDILAAGSVSWTGTLVMADLLTGASQYIGALNYAKAQYISPLGVPLSSLAEPLHAGDTEPSRIV